MFFFCVDFDMTHRLLLPSMSYRLIEGKSTSMSYRLLSSCYNKEDD